MMTPLQLEQALDRWGSDLGRWPAEPARQARALLAADPQARRLLESAGQVDGYLAALRDHEAPGHLVGRIRARAAAAAATDPVDRALSWFAARAWRPALVAVLLSAAGFLTGLTVTEPDPLDPELAEEVMTLAFSDIYSELDDANP